MRQADEFRQFANVSYETLKPAGIYRKIEVEFEQFTAFDFERNYNRIQYELKSNLQWKNNWWTAIGVGHKPRIFINTFLRGGPRWRFSDENFVFLFFGSNENKKFSFSMGHVHSIAKQNNFKFKEYELTLNYQPINALKLSLETKYNDSPNRTQYVTTENFGTQKRYILGEIDRKTLNMALRINYSLNPNLSVQFYGSPFVARGRYSKFNYVVNSTAKNLYDRVAWYPENTITKSGNSYLIDEDGGGTDYSFRNPDFSQVQFRSNLVVRWEYTPGSEVFFVWSQGGNGFATPQASLTEAFDNQIIDKRLDNTFLIKATYRFRR